jgi:general secretion pathway protein D
VANDGMVRLEIHPERSSGAVDENGIPSTATSEVTTNVMVPDGSTVVIGGLMEDHCEVQQSGVPFLSNLPWLGALFRRKINTWSKKELIVLLTPRTCGPNIPANPHFAPAELIEQVKAAQNDAGARTVDLNNRIRQAMQ